MQPDKDTLFDLIGAINDHRRSLDAAALRAGDPARGALCQEHSRAQGMAVSRITRELAQRGRRREALSNLELDRYVDSLIEACADDGADPFAAAGELPAAPMQRDARGPTHKPRSTRLRMRMRRNP